MASTSTAKNTPTPKRSTTRKANPERAPKPEFIVIEDNLHYSHDGEHEIVVTIDPVWRVVEPIMTNAEGRSQQELVVEMLNLIYGEETTAELFRDLKTSQFFDFVYRWMEEFQKRMGIESPGE